MGGFVNSLVFGTDLDDCVTHTAIEIIKELGYESVDMLKHIHRFSISECLNIPRTLVDSAVDRVLERTNLKIQDSFIRVVPELLHKVGHIYVITSRHSHIDSGKRVLEGVLYEDEFTLLSCDRYPSGIPNKAELITQLGIGVFVEDRYATAVDIVENTNSYVLLMNKPWNRRYFYPERVVRVNDWYGVLEFVSKLKERR